MIDSFEFTLSPGLIFLMTFLCASDETLVTYLSASSSISVLMTRHSVMMGCSRESSVVNSEMPA